MIKNNDNNKVLKVLPNKSQNQKSNKNETAELTT